MLYSLMPMICPECMQNLDHVPLDDPCPQCGGTRRDTQVFGEAAVLAVAAVMDVTVKIGYSLAPGWTYQWRSIQRHLVRLREQYQGVGMIGNVDVEETVHALFLALNHLQDWVIQDGALSLDEPTVKAFVNEHPNSLGLCRAYANTRKHVVRKWPGELIAQITSIESGPKGLTATIGYRALGSAHHPTMEVDALALAQQSECDWRDFLSSKGIARPA